METAQIAHARKDRVGYTFENCDAAGNCCEHRLMGIVLLEPASWIWIGQEEIALRLRTAGASDATMGWL